MYDVFAKYYDELTGDRSDSLSFVQKIIKENHPQAKTLLEIGCGTGTVLQLFEKDYDCYGIDLSSQMIEIAKSKLKSKNLFCQDMTNFKIDKKFDVIICLFDTLNHVLDFADWQRIFDNVCQNLSNGGIFLFDVNTPYKIKKMSGYRPFLQELKNGDFVITKIKQENENIFCWNSQFFVQKCKDNFEKYEENIYEIAVPTKQIKDSLRNFDIKIFDNKNGKISRYSERIYFLAKTKNK